MIRRSLAIDLFSCVIFHGAAFAVAPQAEPTFLDRDRLVGNLWGLRPTLGERGIEVEATLMLDHTKGVSGGASRTSALRGLFDLAISFDMATLAGIEGGSAFIDAYSIFGEQDSGVGNVHGISNIDADVRDQVAEVWWQQLLADEQVRLKVGKFDANSEFAWVEHGGEFIGPAWGVSPNILGMPTYPETAFATLVEWTPDDRSWFSVGAFDGANQSGFKTGLHGIGTAFGEPGDLWLAAEGGRTWNDGRFGVGAWSATGDQERFDGETEEGTEGVYALLDQFLHVSSDGSQSTGLFARAAWADPSVSEVRLHLAAGVTWYAPSHWRPDDMCGVALSYADLSADAGFAESYEAVLETFYRFQWTPAVAFKPNLQYVVHPGGDDTIDNAFVPGLRLETSF